MKYNKIKLYVSLNNFGLVGAVLGILSDEQGEACDWFNMCFSKLVAQL